MRIDDVKFRAWIKKECFKFDSGSRMANVGVINVIDKSVYIYDGDNVNEFQVLKPDFLELMQCSGLKDKNDNDIYENDICLDSKTQELYEVGYENSKWTISSLNKTIGESKNLFENNKNLIIVGNIFEGFKEKNVKK